jgi:putative glutamine amidotransferase
MRRPRIGIPLDRSEERRRYELPQAYADAVRDAGGLPLPLPHGDEPVAGAYLALCDALLVAGGDFDIPPERYGEPRRPACGPSRPERTAFEADLAEAALSTGTPVLGICGGMQLLNVVRGGALHQHLPDDLGVSHEQPPPKDEPSHEVRIVPGTLLARLCGPEPLRVNSTHHQAVSRPGIGVLVSGRSPDGVVEAIELPDHPFALGVQWHPEVLAGRDPRELAILLGLIEAARERSR